MPPSAPFVRAERTGSVAGGERAARIESTNLNGLRPKARGDRPHRRPSHQPHCRAAALERPRVADPRCSLNFAISSAAKLRELPALRSYRNKLPL